MTRILTFEDVNITLEATFSLWSQLLTTKHDFWHVGDYARSYRLENKHYCYSVCMLTQARNGSFEFPKSTIKILRGNNTGVIKSMTIRTGSFTRVSGYIEERRQNPGW